MLVTYTAPNRAHHYPYACALAGSGHLKAFVCGFSRFSARAAIPELGEKLIRADHVQNFFLASQRLHMPGLICDKLAYLSKLWLDRMSQEPAMQSDVFLFYNGAGLSTARRIKPLGVVRVVEAVNSHVLVQDRILREEYIRLGLPPDKLHARSVARRIAEYEEADAVLCPSRFVRDSFVEMGFAREKMLTVPYGFTKQAPGNSRGLMREKFRVLYVGQIHIRKGLRYLFDAFSKFRHPCKELWIVGPKTHVTGIDDLRPPEGTKFFGALKGEELAAVYRDATVFVLPSLEEGLALVMGEALSFGLPVIATWNSGASDLFTNGVEGFHVPIRDSGAILEKLQLLADDRESLLKMGNAASIRSLQLGGWKTSGQLLNEALARLSR